MKKKTKLDYIIETYKLDKHIIIYSILKIFVNLFFTLFSVGIVNVLLKIYDNNKNTDNIFINALIVIGIFTFIEIIMNFLSEYVRNYYYQKTYMLFCKAYITKVYKKLDKVDYNSLQDKDFINAYDNVYEKLIDNGNKLFNSINDIIIESIALIAISSLFAIIDYRVFLYIIGASIINLMINFIENKANYKRDKNNIPLHSKNYYYRRVFTLKTSILDVKTSDIGDFFIDKYDEANKDYLKNILIPVKVKIFTRIFQGILMTGITCIFLILIAKEYSDNFNIVMVGTLVSAISVVSNSIDDLCYSIGSFKECLLYKDDYYKLMNYSEEFETKNEDIILDSFNNIEFKNVSFAYEENNVLSDINLKINKGDKIAIVGENGAGKSTFISLLFDLYDKYEGNILYNGISYRNYNPKKIRQNFSSVFQTYNVYSVSVSENILLRKCETEEDEKLVIDALKKVGLYDKVMSTENGLNTIVTKEFDKDGIELSGGEKQKLCIARIFCSNNDIIVLDEPNSALDPLAEGKIFDEIFDYVNKNNKTLIFISHRLSTTIKSDIIYLFDNGVLKEKGTHKELMNYNSLYKKLFNIQAKEYIKGGVSDEASN